MKELIIGSTALKYWFPEFREPKDLDVMSKEGKMTQKEQNYWVDSFQLLIDKNTHPEYLDPQNMLNLKASHFGFNINWEKTCYDILFLKNKGYKINKDIYYALAEDWKKVHGKQWASLKNKNSKNFFEDAVKRKYVHDDLHVAVSQNGTPVYEKTLKESGKVFCCEEKFNDLPFEEKLLMVKEEIWVTSLERFLIPNDFKYSAQLAYYQSLKKLTTTMSSGWFKFFIIDNFEKLYNNKDRSYIEKFKKAELEGKIKLNN